MRRGVQGNVRCEMARRRFWSEVQVYERVPTFTWLLALDATISLNEKSCRCTGKPHALAGIPGQRRSCRQMAWGWHRDIGRY